MNLTCDEGQGGCGHKWEVTDDLLVTYRQHVECNASIGCPNPNCARTLSPGRLKCVIHLIDTKRTESDPRWPGFPLKTPVIPDGRRKNGARPGVSFEYETPREVPEEPSAEEIQRVRRYFASQLDEGTDCPSCTRYAKRQRRPLGCGPARWLIELVYLSDEGQPIHTGTVLKNLKGKNISGSDATSVLPLYGMIEPASNPDASKNPPPPSQTGLSKARTSGYWKSTQLGRDFVFDKVKVPARVVTCLGNPEAFEGDPVTIREALGKKFNYDEIMGRKVTA